YCPQVRRLYSDSLALFPSLRSLTFAHNSALGVLSSSFFTARQASLQYVDLAHNQLSDTIPYASIALCKYLTDLSLSHNNFSGAFHPRVMDMGSATIYSRYLNLSFNQLNAIVPNTYTIPASGITLQLNHNLISNDNGFIKKLYSALANHPNASYWYFDNNRLSNSKLVTTQAPMDNGYYAISPSNYVYVMPQFLGDTVYMDINRLQTAAAVSAPTPVAYDAAFTNIIYTLDGTLTNLGTGAVSLQNASTATNIALSQSAVQTLIGYKKDRMVLNTYINSAPVSSSSELDYKYIQFAPAIIRFYDQPVISLKGVNPLLCQDKKLFKIRLEALGIAATSTVQVAFRKTELVNGNAVVTNYPLNNTLFKSAALVSDKFVYIEVPLSVNASNCKFEITAIEVKNQLGLPITGITFTNAENNASVHTAYKPVQVSVQDYFCGSNDTLKVKVAHPEPFVRYSLNLPDFVSTLQGDTLYLTKSRLNAEYDRFHLQVFADIEGSCHASIYNKSVKLVQDLNNEADEEMILVPPSCTADALFKFPKPRPDFYYTPGYSGDVSSGFLEQYKTLASAVDTLAIKVHKADLPNYSYSYIKIEHKSCPNIYSEMAYPYHYIYYADTFKLQATDSLAVVNFVERTGYLPDASSDYQWYGRSIYDVSAKTYAPLKDWSYSGAWSNANLFQVMCGRIVGLDFSDKQSSAPSIGNGRDFSLAIDSLPELRSLNISNNYFAGKFDFPKVLNTTHIKSIDISYNDFVDTSFQNFSATALANVKVNARYNRLTYLSLLKANNPQSNGLLLPQGDIDFNAIREVYEHGTIKVVNTFPDTRDGKLSYKWYRSIDGSPILVSTERDLLIPDVE
ncbi:MAG TPA: hypothetical protein VL947_11180, partial [Cytophagales bacterium]|nr:hypothetical protein [Cytophagales bacterium]